MFVFIGLGEILNLLPTYPFKGSKFHVVLFQNVFVGWFNFNFENGFLKKEVRGRKGVRFWKQVRLVQFIYKNS